METISGTNGQHQSSHPDDKPTPRPPRSPGRAAKIRAQNRRREFLERNPGYLKNIDHEFADPVLYANLIRNFQSQAEREADGRAKGYSRVLEGDLLRGEARLQELANAARPVRSAGELPQKPSESAWQVQESDLPPPTSKEEGLQRWHRFLSDRFIRGGDDDFDYSQVDWNDDYGVEERRETQDAWFDDEEPSWTAEEIPDGSVPARSGGETGVQDY